MGQRKEYKPLYHKPSGRAYLWDGKRRIYLGKWDGPPAQLPKEVLARFRAEVARLALGEAPAPVGSVLGVSVAELVDKFLDWAEVRYKDSPAASNLRYYLAPLLDLFVHEQASSIGPKRLKQLQELMAKQGRTRQGINHAIGRIKQLFRWGVSEELVPPETLTALLAVQGLRYGATVAPENKPLLAVPLEDVASTLPELSPTIAAMVKVQLLTGMRPGEVCALTLDEIDRTDPSRWVYRPKDHKMAHLGRIRSVPLLGEVIAVLKPFLRADGKPLFSPADCRQEWEAEKRARRVSKVQPSQITRHKVWPKVSAGDCYTTTTYRRAIERGAARASVTPWSPNRLRKLAAQTVSDSLGLDTARALLGHADKGITARHYAQSDLVQAVRAAGALTGLADQLQG